MDVWQKIEIGNLAHIGERHREERERCGLSINTLQALLHLNGASANQIKAFEQKGMPLRAIDTYWARLSATTGMDVLYILTGDFFPVRLSPDDIALWAVLTHLSPAARAAVTKQAFRLFEAECEADEDIQLCLRYGERYQGIPIADMSRDTRELGLAELRVFVDEAASMGLGQYLTWLRYEADGICRIGLVQGFVRESPEAEQLALLASHSLSRYWWFDDYWERA
jgi:hypothetical protein